MIWNISSEAYALTGLDDCCTYTPPMDAYCGAMFDSFDRNDDAVCLVNGEFFSGDFIPEAPVNVACALFIDNPTSQADCNNIYGLAYNATFVPASSGGYVSSGSCSLTVTADSSCGCPDSLPVTKSIDVCDLAQSAYAQLSPDTLNMFNAPCLG